MFYDRNNLWLGLAIGVLVPFVSYAIFLALTESMHFRRSTCAVIAICVNALVVRYYRRRRYDESLRGIVVATAVYAITWFFYFGKDILETFKDLG